MSRNTNAAKKASKNAPKKTSATKPGKKNQKKTICDEAGDVPEEVKATDQMAGNALEDADNHSKVLQEIVAEPDTDQMAGNALEDADNHNKVWHEIVAEPSALADGADQATATIKATQAFLTTSNGTNYWTVPKGGFSREGTYTSPQADTCKSLAAGKEGSICKVLSPERIAQYVAAELPAGPNDGNLEEEMADCVSGTEEDSGKVYYRASSIDKLKDTQVVLNEKFVSPRVKLIYKCLRISQNGLTAGNHGDGIFGQLTMRSLAMIFSVMEATCDFNSKSRFVDLGSGTGAPVHHVAPFVKASIGIEHVMDRHYVSQNLFC